MRFLILLLFFISLNAPVIPAQVYSTTRPSAKSSDKTQQSSPNGPNLQPSQTVITPDSSQTIIPPQSSQTIIVPQSPSTVITPPPPPISPPPPVNLPPLPPKSPANESARERYDRYRYYHTDNPARDPSFDRRGQYYPSQDIPGEIPVYLAPERNAFPDDSNWFYRQSQGY